MADKSETRRIKLYIDGVGAFDGIKHLNSEYTKLHNSIKKNLIPGTKEYKREMGKLVSMKKVLNEHNAQLRQTGNEWAGVKKQLKGFAVAGLAAFGTDAILNGIDRLIDRFADLSDAITDVQKRTDLDDTGIEQLMQRFKGFNTRTARKELLSLASVAGRLGIKGVDNIAAWVQEADKLNVALGEDLGDIDEVMRNLGAINNLFETDALYGGAEALNKLGSAINELGNAGTARESFLVDFTKRVGGSSHAVGLLIDQVLGYGAVLDEAGMEAETSSTAISQFWIKLGEEPQKYADIAGMAVDDFSKLLKDDFNAAFIAVLEGVKDTDGGVESLAARMGALGADGARMIQTLNALTGNLDKLRDKQELANTAFAEGTSLTREFDKVNNNFAASWQRLTRFLQEKVVSGGFVKGLGIDKLVMWADKFVQIPMSKTLEDQRIRLNGLVGAIMQSNDNEEKRLTLIRTLQSEYPDFLENLDAETVSNEELAERLREVNSELINKILLQRQEEEVTEAVNKKIDAKKRELDTQVKLNEELRKYEELANIELDPKATVEQRLEKIKAALGNVLGSTGAGGQGLLSGANNSPMQNALLNIETAYRQFTNAQKDLEEANKQLLELQAEQQKLRKALGVDDTNDTTVPPTAPPAAGDGSGGGYGAGGEKLKDTQKLLDELEQLRIENMKDDMAREEAMANFKHRKRLDDIASAEADIQVKNDLIKELEIQLQSELEGIRNRYRTKEHNAQLEAEKEQNQRRIEQAKEAEAAMVAANEKAYNERLTLLKLNLAQTKEGTKAHFDAQKEIIKAQLEWELQNVDLTETAKRLAYAETQKLIEALNKIEQQQKKDAALDAIDTAFDVWQTIVDIQTAHNEQQINALQERLETESNLIDERLEKETDGFEDAVKKNIIAESTALKRRKQAEQQAQEEKKKLEEETQAEITRLRKEAASNQKMLGIFQAVVNTALAVTNALATVPYPYNIVAAAAAGAAGAAQVAAITAEPIPEMAEGGNTLEDFGSIAGGGMVSKPKLAIVGEQGNEYVVSNALLRHPKGAKLVSMLEDLKYGRSVPEYAEGGYTQARSGAGSNGNESVAALMRVIGKLEQTVERLEAKIVNMRAYVLYDQRELEKLNEETDKVRDAKNGSRVA